MENLPLVVLQKLFKLMPNLNERIKCSHVCKNWRAAYEATMRPETLCLYFQEFVPLSDRLFYTNERVSKFSFLRMPRSYDYLQFLDSNASVLFASIKKLVAFECFEDLKIMKSPELRFRNQLNHFKSLEHAEIVCKMPALEGAEIDLPRLKVLSFGGIYQFDGENVPVILSTPSLQALKIGQLFGPRQDRFTIESFKFLFPHSLVFLEMPSYEADFKFKTEFANLECLVFHYDNPKLFEVVVIERQRVLRSFGDDFLKSVPSLKFLYFDGNMNGSDLPKLEAERGKFGMENLKIVDDEGPFAVFDYLNWPRYVQQLRNWPGENLFLVFDKLINCQIPFDLFKENYLRIEELKVRLVADQPLLADFLRKVKISQVILEYDCNLGQSFFDEIADSVTLSGLILEGYDWSRLSDPSVLNKLMVLRFEVYYQQFYREVALAVLNNRACFWLCFYKFEEFMDVIPEEVGEDGELRKEPNELIRFGHTTRRVGSEFYCQTCGWISSNDPNRLEDPVRVTLQHVESEFSGGNMTKEEFQIFNS